MISLTIDTSDVKAAFAEMGKAPQWIPQQIAKQLPLLGRKIVPIMKKQIRSRRYTGELENSITSSYDSVNKEVSIGPNAKRGQFDAGLILQEGTKRIPNAPWKPIQAWAIKRGIAKPFFVLLKIREQGIDAHPFLTETMETSDFRNAIANTERVLGEEIAARAVSRGNVISDTSGGWKI